MDDQKPRTNGESVPKKPGKTGTGTPFAGESSASGVPIRPSGRADSNPDPDATVIDARPLRHDPDATVIDVRRYDPDATVVDASPRFDPDATPVDADATIGTGFTPRRTPPPAPSQTDSHASAAVFQIGEVVGGRYEILDLLGEGGMGAVYKASDRELNRFVALKVIRPELASNPSILARFKQELLLAHQVTHRNVIRIYDLGEAGGVKFITMEFVEGRDLRAILREKKRFAPEEAVEIITQVCLALDAAHGVGVIHRDLKPQNIMRDGSGRILVMDFGLARTLEGDGMTQTGAIVGTMEYMSPEQSLGKDLDQRSDIFALGLILYEMLTGKQPFAADSALASLIKRTQERAIPVSDVDAQIPGALSGVVSKCLERDVNERYQNVPAILADLNTWKDKRAAGTIKFEASVKPLGRTLPWPLIIGIVTVLVLAVTGFLLRDKLFKRTTTARAPAGGVSVLVADFTNYTGDPVFDGTLEPMFNVALEGASFINAYNRGTARKLAEKLPNPTDKLDEQSARLVALSQGINTVIAGQISRRGNSFNVSAIALDAATGNALASVEATSNNKDEVVGTVPKLVAPIRNALGDNTPESVQLERAGGAFTASSLEVVHQYGVAMEQQFAGKTGEALQSFAKAAELDPNFARAYSGMTSASIKLDRPADAEKYIKLAMEHVDRMTDRERYRVRGLYYGTSGNWQKCAEEYAQLVKAYPGDNIGHNNLAVCLSGLRKLPEALEEARRDNEMHPNAAAHVNESLFLSFTGDFQGGEREAREVQRRYPSNEIGYLALAFAQLGQGQLSQAGETYSGLDKFGEHGASLSNWGLADLSLYEGHFADAVRMFEKGASSDLAAKNNDSAAEKFATLAYTELCMQHKAPAIAAAEKALANSQTVKVRFLAGLVFAETGQQAKAQKLATGLASEVQSEAQADAKIIEGELALSGKDAPQAIRLLTEANTLLNTWLGHFELGRAYLEAKAFAEADSEFDECLKRRGEALSLFMDDVPSYGFFPPVYYYQGRALEGLKSAGFADSYRNYLSIRGQATEDPLVSEIHRRVAQ
jgi:eukaryotic-like serine/threonine-protein kinase